MSNSKKLDTELEQFTTASAYVFSAQPMDQLGAVEYTLIALVVDASGSVSNYAAQLEEAIGVVAEACQLSPRANNLMLRVTKFNQSLTEVHGFKLLGSVNKDDYKGVISPSGSTALIDSAYEGLEALGAYGKELAKNDYIANAILFIITDGEDNVSTLKAEDIKKLIESFRKTETLESVNTVLLGVTGGTKGLNQYLQDLSTKSGITQYEDIGSITPKSVAKLAAFISHSISSTSQALGSGGPSKPITF